MVCAQKIKATKTQGEAQQMVMGQVCRGQVCRVGQVNRQRNHSRCMY